MTAATANGSAVERWLAIETSGRGGSVVLATAASSPHVPPSSAIVESLAPTRPAWGLLARAELSAERRHNVDLMPTIARLCTEQGVQPEDLTHLAVSIGPGSYTSLRVGIATARALAQALALLPQGKRPTVHSAFDERALAASGPLNHLRLIGVPTLQAIARTCERTWETSSPSDADAASDVAASAAAEAPGDLPLTVACMLDAKRGHIFGQGFGLRALAEAPGAPSAPITIEMAAMAAEDSTPHDGLRHYVPLTALGEMSPSALMSALAGWAGARTASSQPAVVAAGEGVHVHLPAAEPGPRQRITSPTAEAVLDLAIARWQRLGDRATVTIDQLLPIYIRLPEAQEKWLAAQITASHADAATP